MFSVAEAVCALRMMMLSCLMESQMFSSAIAIRNGYVASMTSAISLILIVLLF